MGERDRALAFREHVRSVFFRRGHWYCRIDMTGRSWGRDFYRWGIMPFLYYSAKIDGFSKNGT
jgi:hypothetical protein